MSILTPRRHTRYRSLLSRRSYLSKTIAVQMATGRERREEECRPSGGSVA